MIYPKRNRLARGSATRDPRIPPRPAKVNIRPMTKGEACCIFASRIHQQVVPTCSEEDRSKQEGKWTQNGLAPEPEESIPDLLHERIGHGPAFFLKRGLHQEEGSSREQIGEGISQKRAEGCHTVEESTEEGTEQGDDGEYHLILCDSRWQLVFCNHMRQTGRCREGEKTARMPSTGTRNQNQETTARRNIIEAHQ